MVERVFSLDELAAMVGGGAGGLLSGENDEEGDADEGDEGDEEEIPQLVGSVGMINISAESPAIASTLPYLAVSTPLVSSAVSIPYVSEAAGMPATSTASFLPTERAISLVPSTKEVKREPVMIKLGAISPEPSGSVSPDILAAYNKITSLFNDVAAGSGSINVLYAKMLVNKIVTHCSFATKSEEILNGYFVRMP
jgi:hypothetical protein